MSTVLVTGMAGGLAQLVARKLLKAGHEVIGVDYRRLDGWLPDGIRFYRASYNKTHIEDIFRYHRFDSVLHLGRVGNLKESAGKRFDLNVVGTQKIMNLCLQHHVKRLVVMSTFHIYGADPGNHIPIFEDEPLRAGLDFPQIADAIQLDNMASMWVYRHPEVFTTVLRPTSVVGPHIRNTLSNVLRWDRVPHIAGFNPMTQCIHEEDLSDAILRAGEADVRGVFNLAGEGVAPWRTAIKLARASTYPIPSSFASIYARLADGFPPYLVNFFKYPCVISDRAFRQTFDWQPKIDVAQAIQSTVSEARERNREEAA